MKVVSPNNMDRWTAYVAASRHCGARRRPDRWRASSLGWFFSGGIGDSPGLFGAGARRCWRPCSCLGSSPTRWRSFARRTGWCGSVPTACGSISAPIRTAVCPRPPPSSICLTRRSPLPAATSRPGPRLPNRTASRGPTGSRSPSNCPWRPARPREITRPWLTSAVVAAAIKEPHQAVTVPAAGVLPHRLARAWQ